MISNFVIKLGCLVQNTDSLPMPQYLAFLRAINVGGHTVKPNQLRCMFEALSFANIETFIVEQ
ncbi:DUF1697 domain-containing protein [candidate division KSB1 bacterium]|nr:MAG: DUF1697 domain-containing protein [candidate division KSB1 bacterium]MBC6948902.1 DUF1697 domain-containing protein [candidate division KSB1 bacterium]MCE7942072.1 DUF1697 domain-containing protein [Chlorobi bacterium CHB1]